MLIKFTDTYEASIQEAYKRIAQVNLKIADKEQFVGSDKVLDRYYAFSLVLSALVDIIENDDNTNPIGNESFLQDLNYLLTLNII